jgi:hypothetical protein
MASRERQRHVDQVLQVLDREETFFELPSFDAASTLLELGQALNETASNETIVAEVAAEFRNWF